MATRKKALPASKGYTLTVEGTIYSEQSFNQDKLTKEHTKPSGYCAQSTESVVLTFDDTDTVLKGDAAIAWLGQQRNFKGDRGLFKVPVANYVAFGAKPAKPSPAKKKAAAKKGGEVKDVTAEYQLEQLQEQMAQMQAMFAALTNK